MSFEKLDIDMLESILIHCKEQAKFFRAVNKLSNCAYSSATNPLQYYALVQGYSSPKRGGIFFRGFFATIADAARAAHNLTLHSRSGDLWIPTKKDKHGFYRGECTKSYGTMVPHDVRDGKFILIESGPKMHCEVVRYGHLTWPYARTVCVDVYSDEWNFF